MTAVTIFGSGSMGQAIGGVLGAGGASVQHIDDPTVTGTITGEIVVLAVPHAALTQIVAAYADQLAGRIVVDITNPVNFETFDELVVPVGTSAAEQLAESLPASRVLKAFNTTFAETLASTRIGPLPTTVLIAGDDIAAKTTLATAITAGGVAAIDAGRLARARELEAVGFLQLTLAATEKVTWKGGFGIVP